MNTLIEQASTLIHTNCIDILIGSTNTCM